MLRILFIFMNVMIISLVHAQSLQFANQQEETLYLNAINQLRCPKCQNQTIAESNAPIAIDLRNKVYELVRSGNEQDQIMRYMTDRYGDFVDYKPPLNESTLILWFAPIMFFSLIIFWFVRQWLKSRQRV